jgi:SAM-dependent methyltransferase
MPGRQPAAARCQTARVRDATGVTAARLLHAATGSRGSGPVPWLLAPLEGASRVLELHCGHGALAEVVGPRWVGVDPAARGPRPVVRGLPTAIPLRDDTVDAVLIVLALPRLPALEPVFAELRRVLVPRGSLVAVVPSVSVRSVAELRWARSLAPVRRGAWPHRSALDHLGWLLHAADFAVPGDDRVAFSLPLEDAADACRLVDELPAAGIWPELPRADHATVTAALVRRAGPGATLPIPLRRVVGRR